LPKGVDKNWKLSRFLEAFKENGAVNTTREDEMSRSLELGGKVAEGAWVCCQAQIRTNGWLVTAFCDPQTKFLNEISICRVSTE
jgi:hypothetical protein